jgi:hypothetical protein
LIFNSSYFKSLDLSSIHSALLPIPYPIFDLYDLISHDSHIALTWNFFLWLSYVSLKDFASEDHSLFALSRVIYNFSWPFLFMSVLLFFSWTTASHDLYSINMFLSCLLDRFCSYVWFLTRRISKVIPLTVTTASFLIPHDISVILWCLSRDSPSPMISPFVT